MKLKQLFSGKTIRGRMSIVQIISISIAFLLMGGVIYTFTCRLLTEKKVETYEQVLFASENNMESRLDEYREIARVILDNRTLQRNLSVQAEKSDTGVLMNHQIFQRLDDSLSAYSSNVSAISSLYLFDQNGRLFYLDSHRSTAEITDSIDYNKISRENWFLRAQDEKGYEIFVGYNVIDGNEEEFSCVKLLRSMDTLQPIGMLVLNIDKNVFSGVFTSAVKDEGIYVITAENSGKMHLICQQGYEEERDQTKIEELLKNENRAYHYTIHVDRDSGWILKHLIKKSAIVSEAKGIRRIILVTFVLTILVYIGITLYQAYRITEPLYRLRDNIILVGAGERKLPDEFEDDEIGLIGREFGRMVQEKLVLSEKITQAELEQKEAQLELLQSQINPHFLYNTLDSIYWMAIMEDVEDIAEMVQALSDIFRISLNNGEELITVEKELEFIKNYLLIQNIRFQDRFVTNLICDEEIKKIRLIKLILQPLVENAIYHGLEPKVGKGKIEIHGFIQDDMLCFTVSDDGVGMDVEHDIPKGYAVRNVMERLKLVYGDGASLYYDSELGKGTTAFIQIPLEEVDKVEARIG